MPVTIEAMIADLQEQGSRRTLCFVPQSRVLSDGELVGKPLEYPAMVETAVSILAMAGRALPLLAADRDGSLSRPQLIHLLGSAMDQLVLDRAWEQSVRERLLARSEALQRRRLTDLLRGQEDQHSELVVAAAGEAQELRLAVLSQASLEKAVDEMLRDGFLVAEDDGDEGQLSLPGSRHGPQRAFHAEAVRAAVAEHLEEVRRWNLPAPTPERFVELAVEHSRALEARSPATNTMLRSGVRRHVETALERLCRTTHPREAQVLGLLLAESDLPLDPQGMLDVFQAADHLEATLLAEPNVLLALEELADDGVLQRWPPSGPTAWYLDPLLLEAAQSEPARLAALRRHLGGGSPLGEPAPTLASPPADEVEQLKQRLRKLHALHDEGLITGDDFERRKTAILDEI